MAGISVNIKIYSPVIYFIFTRSLPVGIDPAETVRAEMVLQNQELLCPSREETLFAASSKVMNAEGEVIIVCRDWFTRMK